MKATNKDIVIEVKKTFGRFFAILMIVLIGVAFFSGISAASGDMKNSADVYYDKYNFYDIKLLSTTGLFEDDIKDIEAVEGVSKVTPVYSKDFLFRPTGSSSDVVVKIKSVNDNNASAVNVYSISEGRLPVNKGECAIKCGKMRDDKLSLGDKIKLKAGDNTDISNYLEDDEYEIVGFVFDAEYTSFDLGSSDIGNGRVNYVALISEDEFKLPVYTTAYITVDGASQLNSYVDDEYKDKVDAVKDRLEALGEEEKSYDFMFGNTRKWYVLDRNANYSYVGYENSANQMGDIALVFPVFFFFVAALVCLTTMTRMVDEQRNVIGTYKALGYSKIAIAKKYVLYAFSASLIGGIIGCLIGNWVFPTVIYYTWEIAYQYEELQFTSHYAISILAVAAMTMITTFATIMACYKELVAQPSQLMRPKTPKTGKKVFLERIPFIWKRFSFIYKVTARNILRYKRRFFMTLIGISGCTALLLAGFGIKDSIEGLVRKQFEEIYKYNVEIELKDNKAADSSDKILSDIKDKNYFDGLIKLVKCSGVVTDGSKEIDSIVYVAKEDNDEFHKLINLRKPDGKTAVKLDDEGIILSQKAAADLKKKKGDSITLDIGDERQSVVITDVVEMYVGHYVYMTNSYYEKIFKDKSLSLAGKPSLVGLINELDNDKEAEIGSEILEIDEVDSITFSSSSIERFNEMLNSLGMVTLVLIISAGALAFVVLYNLSNVNVSERIREIATIKVLGFYDKEVSSYVYRESIAISIIGALCGLGLGVLLHMFIMKTIEMSNVTFGHEVKVISYVYAFVITMAFSVIVNLVMHKKLKTVPMVESLKSVE